jgi:hypothetical protein
MKMEGFKQYVLHSTGYVSVEIDEKMYTWEGTWKENNIEFAIGFAYKEVEYQDLFYLICKKPDD